MKIEYKQHQRELNGSDEQNLFHISPNAIIKLNSTYQIVDINPAAKKLIDFDELLLNQPIEAIGFNQHDKELLKDYIQQPEADRIDLHIKSNRFLPVHVYLKKIQSNNCSYCFIEEYLDTNSIKRELVYYKKALDALDDGAILFDQDGLIFYANPAAQKNLAEEHKNIIGMNIKQLWSQTTNCTDPIWWNQLTLGHSYTGSITIPPNHANENTYNICINPLSSKQPNTLGFVCLQKRRSA